MSILEFLVLIIRISQKRPFLRDEKGLFFTSNQQSRTRDFVRGKASSNFIG